MKLPLSSARTGLSAMLNSSVCSTAPTPDGGVTSAAPLTSVSDVGNMKLASTATAAALKVPTA